MFRNLFLSLILSFVCVSAFVPGSSRSSATTKLSMTRLRLQMDLIIKIPLSSQSISNEVIDAKQLYLYNSAGRRPLMGGNWKLNPRSVASATKLAEEVKL